MYKHTLNCYLFNFLYKNDSIRYDALLVNLKDNIANVICCVKIFIY